MNQDKPTILSTLALTPELVDQAAQLGIIIENISFIETTPIINDGLETNIKEFYQKRIVAVFTSMRAVEAVIGFLTDIRPDWRIFCIGFATKELIKHHFGENSIIGTADSATALADVVLSKGETSSVIFFCGDKRRDELPVQLRKHNIEVREMEVYRTLTTAQKVQKHYDAILFYSPSGVIGFFMSNTIFKETVLFA